MRESHALTVLQRPDAAHQVRPLQLVRGRVSAAQARLSRRIGVGLVSAELRNGMHMTLQALFGSSDVLATARGDLAARNSVRLSVPAGDIELAEGARVLRVMTGIDSSNFSQMPAEQSAWLQGALFGRLGNTPFAGAWAMQPGGEVPADEVWLYLSLRDAAHSLTVLARASASVWLEWLGAQEWSRVQHPVELLDTLSVTGTVCVARHRLPAPVARDCAWAT